MRATWSRLLRGTAVPASGAEPVTPSADSDLDRRPSVARLTLRRAISFCAAMLPGASCSTRRNAASAASVFSLGPRDHAEHEVRLGFVGGEHDRPDGHMPRPLDVALGAQQGPRERDEAAMVVGGETDGVLGVGDRLPVEPSATGRDARLAVRQGALGIQFDRGGGGDQRAIGVVVGELCLPEQAESVDIVGILDEQRAQHRDRLGGAPAITQMSRPAPAPGFAYPSVNRRPWRLT